MGFSISRAFKSVTKVFRAVKAFNFLGSINPFVALGVFAVGWLFVRSRKPDVPDFGTNDFDLTPFPAATINAPVNFFCIKNIW